MLADGKVMLLIWKIVIKNQLVIFPAKLAEFGEGIVAILFYSVNIAEASYITRRPVVEGLVSIVAYNMQRDSGN